MTHRERLARAIRFESPDFFPVEIHDVPHLYDAYGTLDTALARPGTERFDGIRVTYHWTFTEVAYPLTPLPETADGLDREGESETSPSPPPCLGRGPGGRQQSPPPCLVRGPGGRYRRDDWGCLQRVPADMSGAYEVIAKPLVDPKAFADYRFPDPAVSDPFFARTKRLIAEHYPDKFVCGYVDPGPLLVAFNLMGYDGLLMRLHDDLPQVLAVMRGIVDYQKGIIDRWAVIGVPMVSIIDEFAGTDGLMFSPKLWREHFLPLYDEIFRHIQGHGMLCGCLFDGDIRAILDDYLALRPDVVEIMQPNLVGIENWGQALRGKVCAKASVDMMTTLASGTPQQCAAEARKLAQTFHTPAGGFIGVSLRWHRPEYPADNVTAVAQAWAHPASQCMSEDFAVRNDYSI